MSGFYLGNFEGYDSYEVFKEEYKEAFGCDFVDLQSDGFCTFDIDTPKDLQHETIKDILRFAKFDKVLKFLKENRLEIEAGRLALKLVGSTDKRDDKYFSVIARYSKPISASKYDDDLDEWEECPIDEYWDNKKRDYDWEQIEADEYDIEYETKYVNLQFADWFFEVWELDRDGDYVDNVTSDFDIDFSVSIPVGVTGDVFCN